MADDFKRPLLESWQRLNLDRDGPPSETLKRIRKIGEGLRRFQERPDIREIGEALQRFRERFQEKQVAQRMLGRAQPVSKRRRGRPTKFKDEEAAINLVLGWMPIKPNLATKKLRDAGYGITKKTGRKIEYVDNSTYWRRIIKPATERWLAAQPKK
jgi:hypothetical protein